jgi:hypothetical protein
MRIGWSSFNAPPKRTHTQRNALDLIAREIAEEHGVNWEELNSYPGYGKNRWRELAELMISAPALPKPSWN